MSTTVKVRQRTWQASLRCALLVLAFSAAPLRCQESQPSLRGLAEFGSVTAQVAEIRSYLLPACRSRGFQCVLVHLKNNSDQTITVDGDNAKATIAGNLVDPRNTRQITKQSRCRMSVPAMVTLTVVSLGFLGTPGPILYEILTNKRDKYFYNSGYGFMDDGVRHEIEGARFGKRVMLKGDETDGWFCFNPSQLSGPAKLNIPVSAGKKSGAIEVNVKAPDTASLSTPVTAPTTVPATAPASSTPPGKQD